MAKKSSSARCEQLGIEEFTVSIESKAVFSKDGKYRYLLQKTWDKNKKRATVIMLNPSKADGLKMDKTVMNVINFFADKDFGSITIVNLFAYIATNPKDLANRKPCLEELNNQYINEAFSNAHMIVIAWTKSNYKTRKKGIEEILKDLNKELKCFKDGKGKKPRHPRDLGASWVLEDYEFQFISK